MNRFILIVCFMGSALASGAQVNTGYVLKEPAGIYNPSSETLTTEMIARQISLQNHSEKDKLFAIHAWVTTNIRYDTDSMYTINSEKYPEARITAALRRGKGVCENFAAIFCDISSKCGIPCQVISGYTKQLGSIDKSGHSWCSVYLQNDWFFCDPTWDEGSGMNYRWFLVEPSTFIESHMPFDPLWQLLPYRISHKDFIDGRTGAIRDKPVISFRDSVQAYLQSNRLQQLESSIERLENAGIANELIKNRASYLRMQAGIIHEEKDMILYNNAVADFNKANDLMNEFILLRNNRFIPGREEKSIFEIFNQASIYVSNANQKLDSLLVSPSNYQYDPEVLKHRLSALSQKISDQLNFTKKYFASGLAEKEKLFLAQ